MKIAVPSFMQVEGGDLGASAVLRPTKWNLDGKRRERHPADPAASCGHEPSDNRGDG